MVGLVIFAATKIGDPARFPVQLLAVIAFPGAGASYVIGSLQAFFQGGLQFLYLKP